MSLATGCYSVRFQAFLSDGCPWFGCDSDVVLRGSEHSTSPLRHLDLVLDSARTFRGGLWDTSEEQSGRCLSTGSRCPLIKDGPMRVRSLAFPGHECTTQVRAAPQAGTG